MKKSLTLLLLLLAVFTITGCEKEGPIAENESPSILGVVDESTIILGESFDALEGVTASDPEDGDVTGEIVVTSIPLLSDVAGVFTPTETGDYYLTYKATDSNGEAVEAYSTLKVMPQVSEKVSFTEFVFTEGTVEFDGYEVAIGETAVGTFEASKGVLSIDLTANGDADWHAQLAKTGIEIAKGNTYEFIIRMKATETVKTHFIINNAEIGWAPYGGQWNMEVGTEFANYTIEFLANDDSANAEFLLQYGGDNFDGFTNTLLNA